MQTSTFWRIRFLSLFYFSFLVLDSMLSYLRSRLEDELDINMLIWGSFINYPIYWQDYKLSTLLLN